MEVMRKAAPGQVRYLEVEEGRGGRWRWYLRAYGGDLLAMSPVDGYASGQEARAAAATLLAISSPLSRYDNVVVMEADEPHEDAPPDDPDAA